MYSSFLFYFPEDGRMVCWNMQVIMNITKFNILVCILLVLLLYMIPIQLNK
jgi:hypothetical protein